MGRKLLCVVVVVVRLLLIAGVVSCLTFVLSCLSVGRVGCKKIGVGADDDHGENAIGWGIGPWTGLDMRCGVAIVQRGCGYGCGWRLVSCLDLSYVFLLAGCCVVVGSGSGSGFRLGWS